MMAMLTHWLIHYGPVGLFLLMALGIIGLPIPDETALTFAGVLVYRGLLRPGPTLAAAFLGSACGITVSYVLGRTLGLRLVTRYSRFLHVTEENLVRAHDGFQRVGHWALLFGYFLPGIRHLTALAAGTTKLEFQDFALFAYAGAFVWSFTFVSLGIFVGRQWRVVLTQIHENLLIASVAIVAAALVAALVHWFITSRRR
jgi:membrane protein DedA with SNARE-associated domain